jgi:hypothetical protein
MLDLKLARYILPTFALYAKYADLIQVIPQHAPPWSGVAHKLHEGGEGTLPLESDFLFQPQPRS